MVIKLGRLLLPWKTIFTGQLRLALVSNLIGQHRDFFFFMGPDNESWVNSVTQSTEVRFQYRKHPKILTGVCESSTSKCPRVCAIWTTTVLVFKPDCAIWNMLISKAWVINYSQTKSQNLSSNPKFDLKKKEKKKNGNGRCLQNCKYYKFFCAHIAVKSFQ